MFGGNPSKNPFGSISSGAKNIFGTSQESSKPSSSRKRGNDDSSSRLYGMPPVPQIGENLPVFGAKKSATEEKPSSNIFASALKGSSFESKNIFSKPAISNPAPKPDLFKSISESSNNPFQQSKESSKVFQSGSEQKSTIFQAEAAEKDSGFLEKSARFGEKSAGFAEKSKMFGGEKTNLFQSGASNPFQSKPLFSKPPPQFNLPNKTEDEEPESEDEKQTSPKFQRLTSKEEIKAIKSVVCEQVPPSALNKKVLEKHFSKFGKIVKLLVNLKKATATIHFEDHKSAKKAKEKGHTINAQIPPIGAIFYRRVQKTESPEDVMGPPQIPDKSSKLKVVEENKNLLQIVKSQAQNDADKYHILDARDKLMREKSVPRTGRLKGCCPDICPEKERYSRAFKNQLRIYEKVNGLVNHKATVKEYSRSSADQEVPHLHELRPSHVLQLTFNHLLCNVIDRVEMNLGSVEDWYLHIINGGSYPMPLDQSDNGIDSMGDWFEYLWSTTRAIRKDITQQDLNKDPLAVDLIEKIARFHIMCAERLVEEDSQNFSKKLNDENLTKCMQTLKHMYYDMGIEGFKCPNETEFRCYDVLLNLNDGDTLRSIQTLDEEVRTSSEIKFAIAALTAVNNNNYIKFFKLVRKATLLQGCILLRYFDQVRQKALETMVRAYCPGKNVVQYSLSKITSMLAFESPNDCSRFCNLHGLSPELDSDTVYMERTSFFYPETSSTSQRARYLVESKRTTQWSVVINGNLPLPNNPYLSYVPHNSFDANGFLMPQALDAGDQLQDKSEMIRQSQEMARQSQELAKERARKAQEMALKQALEQITEEIINEVVFEKVTSMGSNFIAFFQMVNHTSENIQDEVLSQVLSDISKDVIKEARNEEIQRRLQNEAKNNAIQDICQDLISQVTEEYIKEIATEEMMAVDKLNKHLNHCPEIADDLINQVVSELLGPQLAKAVDDCFKEREEKIHQLRQRQLLAKQERFFKSWARYVKKRKSQRMILDKFPCLPSSLKTNDQFKSPNLSPFTLRETLKIRDQVDKLHQVIDLEDKFLEKSILEPFKDLPDLLHQHGLKQWKMIFCSPSLNNDNIGKGLVEMVKKKLSIALSPDQDHDGSLLSCFTNAKASVAIRCIDSDMIDEELVYSEKKRRDFLTGTSGLLFLHIDEEESVEDAKCRLFKLIDMFPKFPKIALTVLTTNINSFNLVETPEGVHSFDILETSVDIFKVSSITSVMNSIINLVEMSQNFDIENIKGLRFKLIRDFVEDFLVEQFFNPVYVDLRIRLASKRSHNNPNSLIGLYNEIIDHLIDVVANSELEQISWPIPELKKLVLDEEIPSYWNDFAYLEQVRSWIVNLKLPLIKDLDNLEQYLSLVSKGYNIFSLAHSRIEAVLKKMQRKNLQTDQIPWTDIIHSLIDYKLGQRSTFDPYSSHGSDMVVVYFGHHLDNFHCSKSWQRSLICDATKSTPEDQDKFEIKSELTETMQNELETSLRFEQNLEAMVMNQNKVVEIEAFESDVEEEEENLEKSFHFPVVSILSPHLGLIAGPKSLQQRVDFSAPKKRQLHQESEEEDEKPKKVIKSHLVQNLHDKAETELNASDNFEQKLLAMLRN